MSLDVCGVLPTSDETEQFVADADPAKREKLVDELLARKEFVELWVMKWSELLQIRSNIIRQLQGDAAVLQLAAGANRRQRADRRDGARSCSAAQGGTFSSPATNYFQAEQDRLKTAENVAQVFMGMRIQCAQCHNHPFDRWTMDDYYSFAAFFAQIGRKAGADPRETIVFNAGGGEVNHLVGGRAMPPKFLGGAVPDCTGRDRREVLAEWLASPENPYFAKNLANIVWAHFFGRGIVHEVDDVRVSNPPVNAALLDALGQHFTEYKYDFKRLVRDICTSRTYQLSTQTNETNAVDERNFSHATLRRIRAEVLLDCITPGHRDEGQVRRPAAGRAGRANRRRQHGHVLPDDLRPRHARNRLLVRSEDGAEPGPGAAPDERRKRACESQGGRRRASSCWTKEKRRRRSSTSCICAASAAADRRRNEGDRRATCRRDRSAAQRWKTCSGHCSIRESFCSIIETATSHRARRDTAR